MSAANVRLLETRYPQEKLATLLAGPWLPWPVAGDRAAWSKLLERPLNQQRRAYLVGRAEALRDKPWPQLPATLYLEFVRNGNRSRFEAEYFERRERLAIFALAECFDGRGRFVDAILNALWSICEETSWCLPAHNWPGCGGPPSHGLPHETRNAVDLFAAETAAVVAETMYLFAEPLARLSPHILPRIRRNLLTRVIEEVEAHDDFWWLRGENNWTPWVVANTTVAALHVIDDPQRLARLISKFLVASDRFIDAYHDDGGCDEGPGYWSVAAGALFAFLETLYQRTGGKASIYDQPKIQAMGRYITTVHLEGPYFAAFADAPARCTPPIGMLYRYGERAHVPEMKNMAALAARGWKAEGAVWPPLRSGGNGGGLMRMLWEIFWMPADASPAPAPAASAWLPGIQVLVARSPAARMILAAKAGTNAESHNHNDVGQFVLFQDGEPAIIDAGCETYTRKTFSPQRYELWFTRGTWHNLPVINGVEQVAGAEHRAEEVSCEIGKESATLGMDLAKAYPDSAGVASARRQLRWAPNALVVEDAIRLAKGPVQAAITLLSPRRPEVLSPNHVAFHGATGDCHLRLTNVAAIETDEVPIEDPRMADSWGSKLYRVTLRFSANGSELEYRMEFRTA